MQRSFTFKAIPEVKIHYITTGDPNFTFMEFILKDVLISHFGHQHSGDGERPTERIHLNYTHIECHYHPIDSEPVGKNQVLRTGYDLRKATESLK